MSELIYQRYREIVQGQMPVIGQVLKTDCFNETVDDYRSLAGLFPPARTTYIEIDQETVDKAKARNRDLKAWQGDIRSLPFDNHSFSAVFDLSTIDHIPPSDLNKALAEYERVLKLNGRLVLVSWCSTERREEVVMWDTPQYFMYEPDIMEGLAHFKVYHRGVIHDSGENYLLEIFAAKS